MMTKFTNTPIRRPGEWCLGSMDPVDSSLGHSLVSHNQVQCAMCKRILKIWSLGKAYEFVPRHKILQSKS